MSSWIPVSITVDNICVKINGVEYKWGGGFGAILYSYENGIKEVIEQLQEVIEDYQIISF